MTMLSVTRIVMSALFLDDFDNWDGIGYRNGLLYSDSLCYLNDFRWHVLLPNQAPEIHELLARLFQISVISIHSEVKMRLGPILMDAVDLPLNELLLLFIKIVNLSLKLLCLLIQLIKVKRSLRSFIFSIQ